MNMLMNGVNPVGMVYNQSAENIAYSSGVSVKDKIDNNINTATGGSWVLPAGNISANTPYDVLNATVPTNGKYLLIGAVQAINGNIILQISKGEGTSRTSIVRTWSAPIRSILGVATLNAGEVITLLMQVETAQYFYRDAAKQYLLLVKLTE